MTPSPRALAALAGLGGESRSVLAVLVLASLWPQRFPGGWVSTSEFGMGAVHLGDRACRESLKAAIRRGLHRMHATAGLPSVEWRRTSERDPISGRALREWERRLSHAPAVWLRAWLTDAGQGLVVPGLWRGAYADGALAALRCEAASWTEVRAILLRADISIQRALQSLPVEPNDRRQLIGLRRLLRRQARGLPGLGDSAELGH